MITRLALHTAVVLLALAASAGVAQAQAQPGPAGKPARAQPRPGKPDPTPAGPPSLADSLIGEPKADYDAAKLLYGNGDYAGALVKFTAAYDKSKDPRLLWNIAACEKNLHHYARVLAYLRRYLAEGQAVLSEAEKVDAEALLKFIQPLTAACASRSVGGRSRSTSPRRRLCASMHRLGHNAFYSDARFQRRGRGRGHQRV